MTHINFERFDKNGLKPILDKIESQNLKVVEIEADNKAKRESGFLVKKAVLIFESGQKLQLKAKADGTIFQVKLNNKVMPVKHADDLDEAIKEVVGYVKQNEPAYMKQREKQLERLKSALPKTKAVNTSIAAQTEQFQTALKEIKAANEDLTKQIETAKADSGTKREQSDKLKADLKTEEDRTQTLQNELNALKEAA
ncbi:MAG: hypothetical protein HQK79_20250 [Desulfobacterales bacterium]|nr:hypothetical protein [Desulfobacterales bacterium]